MPELNVKITPKGYTLTLELNGKVYEQKWKATESGSRMVSGLEFADIDEVNDELYDAVENSFFPHDVMAALQTYR